MQPQRWNTVGHAATDFLLRTEALMPDEEKLVFDGLFIHFARGRQMRQQSGQGLY